MEGLLGPWVVKYQDAYIGAVLSPDGVTNLKNISDEFCKKLVNQEEIFVWSQLSNDQLIDMKNTILKVLKTRGI